MNTTKETVDFYSLLKKESGFKVENEGAALNLIQKAFDKFKVDLIKVNDPELIKPREKNTRLLLMKLKNYVMRADLSW